METKEYKLLTTKQVADKIGVSTHQIGYLRKYGFIQGTRFAKAWMYEEDEVNRFIKDSIGKDYWNFTKMTVEGAHKKYQIG